CEAKALCAHERFGAAGARTADEAGLPGSARISYGTVPGFTSVESVRAGQSPAGPAGRTAGTTMHYTSGTTGRPKGVRRKLSGLDPDDPPELLALLPPPFRTPPAPPTL